MNILLIHPAGLSQFEHMAVILNKNPAMHVVLLTKNKNLQKWNGIHVVTYDCNEPDESDPIRSVPRRALCEAEAVAQALTAMKECDSFVPDIIVGHTGWGSLLYAKSVFPEARMIGYCEWYFSEQEQYRRIWRREMSPDEYRIYTQAKNAPHQLQLNACDAAYSPTKWQWQQYPEQYRNKISVIHDGIDTRFYSPASQFKADLSGWNPGFSEKSEIVTYVSCGFETTRCFPAFMEAIRILLKRRPRCHVMIAGNNQSYYGRPPENAETWRQIEEEKGGYDPSRVHFVGWLSRTRFLSLLRISDVHVYLTIPYVLSWSMVQAMSAGCCLVGSASPPVEEVVQDGINGLLVDYQSPSEIAERIEEALSDASLRRELGNAARETILERYRLEDCLQKQMDLLFGKKTG